MSDVSSESLTLARRVREGSSVALAQLQRLEVQHGAVRAHVSSPHDALALPSGDIEDLVILVMLDAAKSAQDDLRSILQEMADVGKARDRLDHIAIKRRTGTMDLDLTLQLLLTVYGRTIDESADAMLGDLDSLNEMGDMESLRLQMMMERMSRMMSMLSNLLKKLSDTSNEIIQNIK